MKFVRRLLIILALLLSHIMFAVVAYNYCGMLCGTEHSGYSAPASVAFIYAIPFVVGIVACIFFAYKPKLVKKHK